MRALIAFDFGPFTFKEVTRSIAWLLGSLLDGIDRLLVEASQEQNPAPLPWLAVVVVACIFGHYINGWRLATVAGACFLYLALFGHWSNAMRTLGLVLLCVLLAVAAGLLAGIASTRSRAVDVALKPVLDLMQSVPHFAYFIPIVFLFGIGTAPGAIAIILFALPPMIRCTDLGLRRVPTDIVEAARMVGCTRWQLLWKVQMPAARPTLMLGVNQVIMQTLAMVVIASLIGVRGLGYDLLFSLQNLRLGLALEQGIAIVVIAIALDRLSRDYALEQPWLRRRDAGWISQHGHLMAGLAALGALWALAHWIGPLRQFPSAWTISTAPLWDSLIRWVTEVLYDPLWALRTWALLYLLLPTKQFYLWLPWPVVFVVLFAIALNIGGWRLAALVTMLLAAILTSGLWEPTVLTLYLVTVSVGLCVLLGVPIGILAARSDKAGRWITLWCDTFQTFPSFVYLIPVVMLFRAGDVAAVTAVIVWAVIPMIRYTHLGLRNLPGEVVEAATMMGCTQRQLLWRVQLPLALPELLLGLNQTIVFALFMVIIAALIGTQDLGREILHALTYSDVGRGLMAGLCIAFIGLIANRILGEWSERRKQALGFA